MMKFETFELSGDTLWTLAERVRAEIRDGQTEGPMCDLHDALMRMLLMQTVSLTLSHAGAFVDPSKAVDACRLLAEAYEQGKRNGGATDWEGIDEAHVAARAALGLPDPVEAEPEPADRMCEVYRDMACDERCRGEAFCEIRDVARGREEE